MVRSLHLFAKWWKTWRSLPVPAWVRAAALYRAGRYGEAVYYYERGLQLFKSHPARFCARMDLAYCLFRERRFQEAEKHLKHVTAFFPASREAHLRLARLQLWTGRSLDAAWTIRRALRSIPADAELIAVFMLAVLDNDGPSFLLKEVIDASLELEQSDSTNLELEAARARLMMKRGNRERGKDFLERIGSMEEAPVNALVLYAEVLMEQRKVANARRVLKQAMAVSPEHPRVLSLMAETYLQSGPFYNPEYARQLATDACRNTGWLSPREMHLLAESYYHLDDKMSALIVASKAKEEGNRLLGAYRDAALLEKLIQDLSSGTQA